MCNLSVLTTLKRTNPIGFFRISKFKWNPRYTPVNGIEGLNPAFLKIYIMIYEMNGKNKYLEF